jgi:hypothetical protein
VPILEGIHIAAFHTLEPSSGRSFDTRVGLGFVDVHADIEQMLTASFVALLPSRIFQIQQL